MCASLSDLESTTNGDWMTAEFSDWNYSTAGFTRFGMTAGFTVVGMTAGFTVIGMTAGFTVVGMTAGFTVI